jgi:hypothetical protein
VISDNYFCRSARIVDVDQRVKRMGTHLNRRRGSAVTLRVTRDVSAAFFRGEAHLWIEEPSQFCWG